MIKFHRPRAWMLAVLLIAPVSDVRAESGRVSRDVTVGPPDHPVLLKAGTTVKLLSVGAARDVITVDFPDGTSGIYQIDSAAVAPIAPTPVAAPTPPAVTIPAAQVRKPAVTAPLAAKPAPNVPPAPTGPPDFDHALIGDPEFDTTAGTQSAGTACLAKLRNGDQCYILTARHLLGPDGGFDKETTLAEIPDFVKGIHFHAFDQTDHYYGTRGLLIKADPSGQTVLWDDLSIFPVDNGPDQPLILADKPPATGDPVWVVGHVRGGVPEGEIMHRARVTVVADNFIEAIFDNDHIITAGASGAPVLNAAGEVIGVYSGHYYQNGHIGANLISSARVIADIRAAQNH